MKLSRWRSYNKSLPPRSSATKMQLWLYCLMLQLGKRQSSMSSMQLTSTTTALPWCITQNICAIVILTFCVYLSPCHFPGKLLVLLLQCDIYWTTVQQCRVLHSGPTNVVLFWQLQLYFCCTKCRKFGKQTVKTLSLLAMKRTWSLSHYSTFTSMHIDEGKIITVNKKVWLLGDTSTTIAIISIDIWLLDSI